MNHNKITIQLAIISLIFLSFNSIVIGQHETRISSSGDWQFSSQRPELKPKNYIDKRTDGIPTLVIEGAGNEIVNGCWYTSVKVEPLRWYEFKAHFLAKNIEEPGRCVLARILWFNDNGKQVGRAEYPPALSEKTPDDWSVIHQVYKVPESAIHARLELVYRWDPDGKVRFSDISLQRIDHPGERIVKLATIHHRPKNSSGSMENLQQFAKYLEIAAGQDADIVCLPEGSTMVGTGLDYIAASEPVPGPSTDFLGQIARKHSMYIIAGLLEKDGATVYNTAVLIDRNGNVAGKYHKVSLPREEIEGGVTPGDELPVFDTDFGKIGMMICWDVTFPEAARTLAFKGAEVIFLPIWGGHLTLAKARALENQIFLVSSTYSMKSAVFDQEGEIMKEATDEDPVVVVEVDLNKRKFWPWLGDFKNRIKREIPSQKARMIE